MNKLQSIKNAQSVIDKRRFDAEAECERRLSELRRDPTFKATETELRRAIVLGDKDKTAIYRERLALILKERSLTEADLHPRYRCPLCRDTGKINGQACDCLQKEIRNQLTSQSNVINGEFTFENSTETNKHNVAVYGKAAKICAEGKGNLLLVGNVGSGKTYLITACVNAVIKQNRSVLFTTAYTLNSMFLDAHLSDHAAKQAIMDALTDVEVLAIDDLGTEISYKNVTAEYLFALVNERIAQRKQTFISTNLTLPELRDRYDERLFSRLVDTSITTIAQLQGADKRLKK